MCLITDWKGSKIAQEDMHVFKVLDKVRSALYMCNHTYEEGVLYKTDIKRSEPGKETFADLYELDLIMKLIDKPRSAYSFNDFENHILKDPRLQVIGSGFHSVRTYERATMLGHTGRMICHTIIPKGSEYYESVTGLLVSNQIIVNGEVLI